MSVCDSVCQSMYVTQCVRVSEPVCVSVFLSVCVSVCNLCMCVWCESVCREYRCVSGSVSVFMNV